MANQKLTQYHLKAKGKPSPGQLASLSKARLARHSMSIADKENQPSSPTPSSRMKHKPKHANLQLNSTKRQNRRLKGRNKALHSQVSQLKTALKAKAKQVWVLQSQLNQLHRDYSAQRKKLLEGIAEAKHSVYLHREQRQSLREKFDALYRKAEQLDHLRACAEARKKQVESFLGCQKRSYGGTAYSRRLRQLAAQMVSSGCTRKSVGKLMTLTAKTFGIELNRKMSRRTVSRVVLEHGVAAKIQIAHEIINAKGMTISQDSTSHRKQNYEAEHIALPVSDYSGNELKPRVRFFCLSAPNDHSSQGSISTWKENISEVADLYNRSPLAKRLNRQFTIRDFLRILKGMSGDHANNEKATAGLFQELKKEELNQELGEKVLSEKEFGDLVLYLASWNAKKITEAGGYEAWNALSAQEKVNRDAALMKQILTDLGQEVYDALPDTDRREVDLFIWAGCCMHKDQNSFKGGNTEMMVEWSKLGAKPPVLLANKTNASILQKVFDPEFLDH